MILLCAHRYTHCLFIFLVVSAQHSSILHALTIYTHMYFVIIYALYFKHLTVIVFSLNFLAEFILTNITSSIFAFKKYSLLG